MDNSIIVSTILGSGIALGGLIVSISNYRLANKKRRDELFDRRFNFYRNFEKFWKTTGNEDEGATRMMLEWDDIIPWEQEATFLFGPDIAKHIRSYEGKSFNGIRYLPDLELAKPFNKYLKMK